jgi:NAD(P)-dependent dehydrogenase (short-subunit alcohol dehydrogenase family)
MAFGVVKKDWSVDITGSPNDVTGKTVLVVGGTNGLGRAIALSAAGKGAKVIVVGRKLSDDDKTVTNLSFVQADLSSMNTAKEIGETICGTDIAAVDVVVFTTGILAKKEREESTEGIEMDMAVSYLSRLVIINYLTPRLKKAARVFIMGFPGTEQKYNLEDMNCEKKYDAFGTHFNTIVGNEALVADWSSKENGILYYGLNPGLIRTGIRDNVYSGTIGSILKPIVEGMIGLLVMSAKTYGTKIVPLLFALNLDEHNGALFSQTGKPIEKAKCFTNDPDFAKKFIDVSQKLVTDKAGITFA